MEITRYDTVHVLFVSVTDFFISLQLHKLERSHSHPFFFLFLFLRHAAPAVLFFFLPFLYYLIRISDRTPEEDGNSWADNCSSSRLPRRCSLFLLLPLPRPEDSEITLVKKTFGVKM